MAMLAERECRSPRGANRAGGARGDAGVGVGKSRYPEGGGGGGCLGAAPDPPRRPRLMGRGAGVSFQGLGAVSAAGGR